MRKCTNTEWCLILNFVKIGGDFLISDEFEFFFFYRDIKYEKLHVTTKLPLWGSQNQVTCTSSKKELCEIGEEAIWESRFTLFFLSLLRNHNRELYNNKIQLICEIFTNKLFLKRPGFGRNVNHSPFIYQAVLCWSLPCNTSIRNSIISFPDLSKNLYSLFFWNSRKAFCALVKHFTHKGYYFAYWYGKRPFSVFVNYAQTTVLHACVKKNLNVQRSMRIIFWKFWKII